MIEQIHQKLSDSKVARWSRTRARRIYHALRIFPHRRDGPA